MTELSPHTLLGPEPEGGALCTLEDVRGLMQQREVHTEMNTVAAALIVQASDLVMDHAEREFAPATAAEARLFEVREGSRVLHLAPCDVRSVTAVTMNPGEASARELAADEYRLVPVRARHGVYRAVRLSRPVARATVVEVAGAWGFELVPRPVRLATAITVVTWLRRDVASFSTTYNLDEGRVERPQEIPSAARGMLAAYMTGSVS